MPQGVTKDARTGLLYHRAKTTMPASGGRSPTDHPPRSIAAAFGLWYATFARASGAHRPTVFASLSDVEAAASHGAVALPDPIRVRAGGHERVRTTVGRVLLAGALRRPLPFQLLNRALDVRARAQLLDVAAELHGPHAAEDLEADLDRFGLVVAARSGVSLAAEDLRAPSEKPDRLRAAHAAAGGSSSATRTE